MKIKYTPSPQKKKELIATFGVIVVTFLFLFVVNKNSEQIFNFFYTWYNPETPKLSLLTDLGAGLLIFGIILTIPSLISLFFAQKTQTKNFIYGVLLLGIVITYCGITNVVVLTESHIKFFKPYTILNPKSVEYKEVSYAYIETKAFPSTRRRGRATCKIETYFTIGIKRDNPQKIITYEIQDRETFLIYNELRNNNIRIDSEANFLCWNYYKDKDLERFNQRAAILTSYRKNNQ